MPSGSDEPFVVLRRCMRLAVLAQLLLVAAGLRHNLVWGHSERWPFALPLLNLAEAGCVVGFVVLAGRAWWRAQQVAAATDVRRLLLVTLPIVAAAVAVPLLSTTDPVDYVIRGRLVAVHGANPYLQVANDFPADAFLAFGDRGWKDMPLPYGPVVANVQAAIAWLAHLLPLPPRGELIAALLLCKLLFAAALFASAWLLRGVALRLRPGSGNAVFVAVMWNPLLLFECVANAHNEPLVLLCLAAALAAALTARSGTAVFVLGLGAMTKVVPALVLPLWGVWAARVRRLPAAVLGALWLLPVAGLFYWQFFTDDAAFDAFRRQSELRGGSWWWAVHTATGAPLATLVLVGRAIVLAWLGGCVVRVWRRPAATELLFAVASTLLLLAVLGAALFGAWYHVWWLPFALLLGVVSAPGYLYRAAVCASVVAPLAYLPWVGLRSFETWAQSWGVAVAIVAPLVGGLLVGRRAAAAPRP